MRNIYVRVLIVIFVLSLVCSFLITSAISQITISRQIQSWGEIARAPTPQLRVNGLYLEDGSGQRVYLRSVNVDWNERMKKYGTTSSANSPEESWFTEQDVEQIKAGGGNCFELHVMRLQEVMPQRNVIDESFFTNWLDKWVSWGEKNQVYFIINIRGFAWTSWGPMYPRWLWEGIQPEPTNDAEADVLVRNFFDTDIQEQEINRQAFVDAWKFIANRYKNNPYAIFGIMNEPLCTITLPDSTASVHLGSAYSALMTQVIDGIRSTGAQQVVFVDKPFLWSLSHIQPVNRDNAVWEEHMYVTSSVDLNIWKSYVSDSVRRFVGDFNKPMYMGEYGIDPYDLVKTTYATTWKDIIASQVAYLDGLSIVGRQWHQWGVLQGEYYDYTTNYFSPEESTWIVQTVLGAK